MATINASEEAHLKIMKQRRKMEEEEGKVVSISEALDVLLEILKKKEVMKNEKHILQKREI